MPQIAQIADTLTSQVFWLLLFFGLTFIVVGLGHGAESHGHG